MNEYQQRVEDFRNHYFKKYGVQIDDEILYLFIRINEIQAGLKKDIERLPKVYFRSGFDYFLYGMGQMVTGCAIAAILLILYFYVLH